MVAQGDAVALWRCGGSLVAHQTSGPQGPGFDQTSPTMQLMRCSLFNNVGNVPTHEAKNVLMGQVKPINI